MLCQNPKEDLCMNRVTHITHNWMKQMSFAVKCEIFYFFKVSSNICRSLCNLDCRDIFVPVVSTASVLLGQIDPISGLCRLGKKNIKQKYMPDFAHKDEAFPIKNGFKIKMFKIRLDKVNWIFTGNFLAICLQIISWRTQKFAYKFSIGFQQDFCEVATIKLWAVGLSRFIFSLLAGLNCSWSSSNFIVICVVALFGFINSWRFPFRLCFKQQHEVRFGTVKVLGNSKTFVWDTGSERLLK